MDRTRKAKSVEFKPFITSPPPTLFTDKFNIGHIVSNRMRKMQSENGEQNQGQSEESTNKPQLSEFMKRAAPTSLVSQLNNASDTSPTKSATNRSLNLSMNNKKEGGTAVPKVRRHLDNNEEKKHTVAGLKPRKRRISVEQAFRRSSSSSSIEEDNFITEAARRIRVLYVGKWGEPAPKLKALFHTDMSKW